MEAIREVQSTQINDRKCKLSFDEVNKLRPQIKEFVMVYSYPELKNMEKHYSQIASKARAEATKFNIQMQTGVVPKSYKNEMKLDALYNESISKNQNLCDVQCAIRTFR